VPGTHITEEVRRKLFFLTVDINGPRVGITEASRQVKISKASAYRILNGRPNSPRANTVGARLRANQIPAPRRYEELPTEAKAALADINVFRELYFHRRPQLWVHDAAMRLTDLVLDKTQRDFVDLNVFPGAGKTTLGHDVIAWMICGGGSLDPAFGRALRVMVGSSVLKVAVHMTARIRRSLDLRRPFYDKDQAVEAARVISLDFGRMRPDTSIGEESIWARDQFLVSQLGDVDLYEKEPTVQAASWESGFLGERVDLAWWDDIATTKNSRTIEVADALDAWFEDEPETRIEPGGVLALVGQRIGPNDLHRRRLDARMTDASGVEVPRYDHIIYPAHQDELCDDKHRQWDPAAGQGCLTDIYRLPERDWIGVRSKLNYRTLYQQEDSDPGRILVQAAWLDGGTDAQGVLTPGCMDRDRGFHEWPNDTGPLIDYVAVDPSAGNWWVAEWWAYQPESEFNYLIAAKRGKIQAGDFLDWDNRRQVFTGWMEEMQRLSRELHHPIRVWVVEAVAAHRYLFQFEHFRRWLTANTDVKVIPHQTQLNKNDPEYGVEGLMPGRYRSGMKRLPGATGLEALNYLKVKRRELTTYPYATTDDTVMGDWCGEWNLRKITMLGKRAAGKSPDVAADMKLPAYLRNQNVEFQR
jgi:hypothetical protein